MNIVGWLIVGLLVTLIVLELVGMYRCWPPRLKARECDWARIYRDTGTISTADRELLETRRFDVAAPFGVGVSQAEVAAAVATGNTQLEARLRRLIGEERL